jgi:hypothetical protein
MDKVYNPILSKETQDTFHEYVSYLEIPEIDYFAIGIQNKLTGKSISIMSRPEWQECFVKNQFANDDPIRKAALETGRNLFAFDEVSIQSSLEEEIMRMRKSYEIKDGIILMQRLPLYNFMITLGTGFSKFDKSTFLEENFQDLHNIKRDLIKIIEKDFASFIPKK